MLQPHPLGKRGTGVYKPWLHAASKAPLGSLGSNLGALGWAGGGGGAGGNSIFVPSGPSFDLPLVNMSTGVFSIAPTTALGSSTPTYTRATAATTIDFEGLLKTCLSGEVRCLGGRRVENLIPAAGTGSASLAVAAAKTMTLPAGDYVFSMGAGTGTATFSGTGGATGTLAANATNRTSVLKTITAGTLIVTASVATLVDLQTENVTGQANQNPASYVSNGVASVTSPVYHGVGVDGVKVFTTLNGNTVASNVVTEATGLPITSARAECAGGVTAGVVDAVGPVGYLAEGARTNLALKAENIADLATWPNIAGITSHTNNIYVAPTGATTMARITLAAGNTEHQFYQGSLTVTSQAYTYSAYARYDNHRWLALAVSDGTKKWASFDLLNGVVGTTTAGVTSTIETTGLANVYRISMTLTLAATASANIYVVANSSDSASDQTWNAAGTELFGFFGAQLEAASFASTYIPTTTAAVARNADVLTYVTAGNLSGTSGTIIAEIAGNSSANAWIIGDGSAAFYITSGALTLFDGTADRAGNAITLSATLQKVGVTYSGAASKTALAGTLSSSLGFDGNVGWAASFGVGSSSAGAAQLSGPIRGIKIYPRNMGDTQFQAATT